jgi:hypothetical protein
MPKVESSDLWKCIQGGGNLQKSPLPPMSTGVMLNSSASVNKWSGQDLGWGPGLYQDMQITSPFSSVLSSHLLK